MSSAISVLAHHGINFVPFGYSRAFPQLTNMEEVHGGKLDSQPLYTPTVNTDVGQVRPGVLERLLAVTALVSPLLSSLR